MPPIVGSSVDVSSVVLQCTASPWISCDGYENVVWQLGLRVSGFGAVGHAWLDDF